MARKKKLDAIDIAAQQRAREQAEVEQAFLTGVRTLRDFIAPSSLELKSDHFRLGSKYGRTMYVYGYPRELYTGWLSSVINIDEVLDISMFIYPVDTQVVLNNLRKKVTQLEASLSINSEKGKVRDPAMEAALQDAEELRNQLQIGSSALAFTSRFMPTALMSSTLSNTRSRQFLASNWCSLKLPRPNKSRASIAPFHS